MTDGKMEFIISDSYEYSEGNDKYDWSFADKYFTIPVEEMLHMER